MPMMFTPDDTLLFSPSKKQPFAHSPYGHEIRTATRCHHGLHPSNPQHTPWCSKCTVSQARAKSDVALKKLVAEGGLRPPVYMRNRRWNRARNGYLIAKQRLEKTRKEEQLRWERERAWDDAHTQFNPNNIQAAVLPNKSPSLCPVCDSLVSSYPTTMPEAQPTKYEAWWEKPSALATSHILVRQTPPRSRNQHATPPQTHRGNPILRQIIADKRKEMLSDADLRRAWEARDKTEAALRRKHGLGDMPINKDFWNYPISGYFSRLTHQNNKEMVRSAERRARGNTARPRPPRSSLSYSETTDDVEVEPGFEETLKEKEEREEWERQVRKVAGEVGYLYFVGGGTNLLETWEEDYERSADYLIARNETPVAETANEGDVQDGSETTDGDANEEDWGDEMDVDDA
ncbi:hypothetical protein J4E93_008989 [Alternaria ventricosa]|uniref:uncharacterized protein n=1 Tax=Alternaria ventricosa TaxID=1187951 RepID=UPI0020C34721|nr:uncharacterized protein J4E93_008989 [Alternaria ventricosa]KAI4639635.1 hypothetical protein J4E93_008989 [Alternaria ventricosa]